MRSTKNLLVLTLLCIALVSCGNQGSQSGQSGGGVNTVPIDSTNQHGTAPGTIIPDDPAKINDTGIRNDVDRERSF